MIFGLEKKYQARDGKRVIIHSIRFDTYPGNDAFPIKGTIILQEAPFHCKTMRWTFDGLADVPKKPDFNKYDLVEN